MQEVILDVDVAGWGLRLSLHVTETVLKIEPTMYKGVASCGRHDSGQAVDGGSLPRTIGALKARLIPSGNTNKIEPLDWQGVVLLD